MEAFESEAYVILIDGQYLMEIDEFDDSPFFHRTYNPKSAMIFDDSDLDENLNLCRSHKNGVKVQRIISDNGEMNFEDYD